MVQSNMRTQLIATMRNGYARRYAADRTALDAVALLKGIGSAELIGAPGYSMRISVEQADLPALRKRLLADFTLQDDYVLHTFGTKRPARVRRRIGTATV